MSKLVIASVLSISIFSLQSYAACQRQMPKAEVELYEIIGHQQQPQRQFGVSQAQQKQLTKAQMSIKNELCSDIDTDAYLSRDKKEFTYILFSKSNNIKNCQIEFNKYISSLNLNTNVIKNIQGCQKTNSSSSIHAKIVLDIEAILFSNPIELHSHACAFLTPRGEDLQYLCGTGVPYNYLNIISERPYSYLDFDVDFSGTTQVQLLSGKQNQVQIETKLQKAQYEIERVAAIIKDGQSDIKASTKLGCVIGTLYGSDIEKVICFE